MDTVGNTLTILLNGQRVGKKRVAVPFSRFTQSLLSFMKEQKLIGDIRVQESPKSKLIVSLAYNEAGKGVISGSNRISKPGRRVYVGADRLPYSRQEAGMIIVSTPEGLMDEKRARGKGIGGELICAIW
ncbi:MAG TPA: 30S ribosomal protein S8 [Candidatus Andersenbacteria bacterium]|nr:30S ribosomal protein S8 [Candidatus Andersenbacteria bacterium]